jgi:hypothetical protein
MKTINYRSDIKTIPNSLHPELVNKANEILDILDEYYGPNRDVFEGGGGYILIIEAAEDFENLKDHTGYEELEDHLFEFVDPYEWGYHALLLKLAEFSISLLMTNESLSNKHRMFLSKGQYM